MLPVEQGEAVGAELVKEGGAVPVEALATGPSVDGSTNRSRISRARRIRARPGHRPGRGLILWPEPVADRDTVEGRVPEIDPDEHTRRLAAASLAAGDPLGWFERLYAQAAGGRAVVPWDRGDPHRLLAEWVEQGARAQGDGRHALVVGCGLGRDAEFLARLGYTTTAFDVSATAIRTARRRFPGSAVRYLVADLLDPPEAWVGAFDLVVESMTVQSLPDPPRRAAIGQVGRMVAPGGTLLVIAAGRGETDDLEEGAGPPWPLTRAEVDAFATGDLRPQRIEDLRDPQDPTVRRWRAEFQHTDRDCNSG